MQQTYLMRALRLMAEDARFTDRTTRVLYALVTANPVARRGEPTMIPSAALAPLLNGGRCGVTRDEGAVDDVLAALGEVDAARWHIPSLPGCAISALIKKYWVSQQSRLLHFQIAPGFIATLDLISDQLANKSGDFPLGGL